MIKRVLFVTDHIHFPQGGGGGERNTHDLCLALRAQGVSPAVASSFSLDGTWLSWSSRVRRALPPRTEYPRDQVCGYPTYRGWHVGGLPVVVQRFRPEVIVVQSTHPAPILDAILPSGVPIVVYVHEVEDLAPLVPAVAQQLPFLANSRFTSERLRETLGIQAAVIRPLIDPNAYKVEDYRPKSVLFVNTVPRKGLEVAVRLAQDRPDVPFDFITSWILSGEQLEALSRRVKASGNVTLHPPTRDMKPHYAQARLLLVPSQWEEAWGRVATEAQMNGIPVLASERGGLPEAVGDGGALLPADASHETWLAAFSALWDDQVAHTRAAEAARTHAHRSEIQPETITREFLSCLNHIAAAPR